MKKINLLPPQNLLLNTLFILLLLTACSAPPPGTAPAPEILPSPTETALPPTELLPTEPPPPTDTLPAPTEPAAEPPTETAPPDSPTAAPTEPPSLLQLAYINISENLALWSEATTGLTSLTSEGGVMDVFISDDGTLVAYLRETSFSEQELWVVNSDGSNPRLLMGVEAFKALDPEALGVLPYQVAWIPDTHTLAFNTTEYIEAPGLFLYNDLYFLDAETGELTIQLTPGTGGNFVFSPDGQQYALLGQNFDTGFNPISLLNTDGTNIRPDVLTYPYVLTYSEYNYYAEPVWAPDSSFLRVAIPPTDSLGEPEAPTFLWEIPVSGDPAFQLGQIVAQPFFIDPVLFSPDLAHIAYTRLPDREDFANAELVVAAFNGGDELVVESGNLFVLGWTPDSQHIVFEDYEAGEVYLADRTGEVSLLLSESPFNGELYWLDDTRYIYVVAVNRGWQIRQGEIGVDGTFVMLELPGDYPVFDFDN